MKNIQSLPGRDFSKLMECPLCWDRMIVMDEWKGKIRTTIWSLAREGATILTSADRVVCEQVDARWVRGAGERYSRSDYTFTFLTSHWDRGNGVVSLFKWRLLEAASGREGGLNRRVGLSPYSTSQPSSPSSLLLGLPYSNPRGRQKRHLEYFFRTMLAWPKEKQEGQNITNTNV